MIQALPPSMRFIERDWLSANQILFFEDDGSASVIDTGYVKHAALTCALVERMLGGRPLARILNTHLHSDHCGGNAALAQRFGAAIFVPSGSFHLVRDWQVEALSFAATGQRCERFLSAGSIHAGQQLTLGSLIWEVHAAAGHDPESIMLFAPSHRILISADALWEDGFGVTFPELSGESGFQEQQEVLERIESLQPAMVIPGHGPIFVDLDLALARARGRLAWLKADPVRNAHYALKVLVKFIMLDLEQATEAQLFERLGRAQVFLDASAQAGLLPDQALHWSLESLLKAGALARQGDLLISP
jgi:glyoxylase-like metal-dependent hydrolase (beta-lactamase superfamily II)